MFYMFSASRGLLLHGLLTLDTQTNHVCAIAIIILCASFRTHTVLTDTIAKLQLSSANTCTISPSTLPILCAFLRRAVSRCHDTSLWCATCPFHRCKKNAYAKWRYASMLRTQPTWATLNIAANIRNPHHGPHLLRINVVKMDLNYINTSMRLLRIVALSIALITATSFSALSHTAEIVNFAMHLSLPIVTSQYAGILWSTSRRAYRQIATLSHFTSACPEFFSTHTITTKSTH